MLRGHDVHGQAAVSVPRGWQDVQGRGDDVYAKSVSMLLQRWDNAVGNLFVGNDHRNNAKSWHRSLLSRLAKSDNQNKDIHALQRIVLKVDRDNPNAAGSFGGKYVVCHVSACIYNQPELNSTI